MLQPSGEPSIEQIIKNVKVPLLFCPTYQDPSSLHSPNGYYFKLLPIGSKSIYYKKQSHHIY